MGKVRATGPRPARVMIVGEAPGREEEVVGLPFIGTSGRLLDQLLHEVGILRTECFVTNVVDSRPPGGDIEAWIPSKKKDITPEMVEVRGRRVAFQVAEGIDRLRADLAAVQPEVVIPLGNAALWALTGKWGITKWAGSRLAGNIGGDFTRYVVLPTIHPAAILREYELRPMVVQDLRRAARAKFSDAPPAYDFRIRPTMDDVLRTLDEIDTWLSFGPVKLSVDIETRAGHIACIGIAWSELSALCIPFMAVENKEGYWREEEEVIIVGLLRRILEHPNAIVIGQNFLYDTQYLFRWWRCVPTVVRDTMGAQHALFAGMPKGLDYLSRMWCSWHVYWKDESKDWDPAVGEDQLWLYNCKDAVATFEIDTEQQKAVDSMGLRTPHDCHQAKFWLALAIMLRGTRRDKARTAEFAKVLMEEMAEREAWFERVLGHPLNPQSPHQLKRLVYEDLQQRPVIDRKTGQPTTKEEALLTLGKREPLLLPLIRRILEHRSLNVFYGTFVSAQPSWDGRIRTQFNPFGPETYRASSSKDAFGSGMNMQNIPAGGEQDTGLRLPNVRELFVPDEGMFLMETDLDRADLQVVVWEAEDEGLKEMLRRGLDVHLYNARAIFGLPFTDDEIIAETESCKEIARRYKPQRQKAKMGCHAANYGVGARTLAGHMGSTVHEADRFLSAWFSAHPGIRRWHERTRQQITTRRYVENRFGFRRYYLGRTDDILPEALAWTPQSTVAEVINKLWYRIDTQAPWIQVLIQVHDSLLKQAPINREEEAKRTVSELAKTVVVPYDDPLVIPVGIKSSRVSWGAAK